MLQRHLFKNHAICASAAMLVICGAAHGGSVLYVDDDAPPGGDGASWNTAYRFLQNALTDASGGGVSEVRVAQGVYQPDRDEANPDGTGDREATFQLINDVALNGGYAGIGAKDPDAINIDLYETILTGDLLGDDGPDFQNNAENSYHVVVASFTDASAIIDGFTITAGRANGPKKNEKWGGGIFNDSGEPRILRCTIIKNDSSHYRGSGIVNQGSVEAWLEDCRIVDCNAMNFVGGGRYIRCTFTGSETGITFDHSTTVIKDCVFQDITHSLWSPITIAWSTPTIINCVFVDNTTGGSGGAIDLNTTAGAKITNCLFVNNHAAGNGGAILVGNAPWETTVTNCTFVSNVADGDGNVIYTEVGTPTLTNCELFFNFGGNGPAIVDGGPKAQTTLNYSSIFFPYWDGAGTNNIFAAPLFVDAANGDFRLQAGSPGIDAADNTAVPKGIDTDVNGDRRFVEDPNTPDTGLGDCPIVDIGSYEFQEGKTECDTSAEVLPTGFTVVKGMLLFGDLEDLFDSDDSRLVLIPSTLVPPSGSDPPVQIEIAATSTTQTPSELRFRYEGHVFMPDAGIDTRQRTSLFNYVTQGYDQLDNRLAASSDEVFEIVITANPGDYVEPGTGKMKAFITYKAEGLSGFLFAVSHFDQTVWIITP